MVNITHVERGSIAEAKGIKPTDSLLTINGKTIVDVLDYRFYLADRSLTLELIAQNGDAKIVNITKREYDDLGLEFETYLMDKQRFCKNKCVFCFIDQMPKGLRDSLYFKDDDSRMSFLFGNYITLTNLTEADIDRIIAMKISPVNVSVHTMNPELRVSMMKNPNSGNVLGYIKQLTDAGIKVNSQIVLCPDLNDKTELEYSLQELSKLAPNLQSIAVVPVGLTKFREGLPQLRLFTQAEAVDVIGMVERYSGYNFNHHFTRICHAADEFYLLAKRPLPDYDTYEDFDQLENGVGLIALLKHEFALALSDLEPTAKNRKITIATGVSAHDTILELAQLVMQKVLGLEIEVVAVVNNFLGDTITVAGLVTGADLIAQLSQKQLHDEVLIPAVMLRHERDLFLDSISVNDAESRLGCKITAVNIDGYELLQAILGQEET